MKALRELLTRLRQAVDRIPGLRVVVAAIRNYILHQSANQAGSVAFSSVLAMFPMLIFLSAAAGFVGHPGQAAALAMRVMAYMPPVVADALRPVIDQVLSERNRALLTVGVVVTVWTASSGMQAIRTALNKAYGVERGMSFWTARIKVTLFTVVLGVGVVATFGSVIVLPYIWSFLRQSVGLGAEVPWLLNSVRYALAFVVLSLLYAFMYGWLPDIRQRLRTVLPGALVGAALWVGAAAMLSYTLRSAAKLVLLYGGFAGVVATLVFLYVSAVTLIFGAEINAVLRDDGTAPPEGVKPAGG
ncbi:MAG: YihY/virulence factor BrkB family protein [Burkholderiaceae bacterium]